MGYLGVQVALGLPAAVLAHLVGHGLWKASLFLGAGGTVSRERASVPTSSPGPRRQLVPLVGDAAVGVAAVTLLAVVPGPWGPSLLEGPASLVPWAVAALAATVAVRAAREQRHGGRVLGYAAVLVLGAVAAYLLGLRLVTAVVEATLPLATPRWGEPDSLGVLAVVVALVAIAVVACRVDAAVRAGRRPRLVALVSRTSLPPATAAELVGGRAQAAVAAVPETSSADVDRARVQVRVACDLVAPVWPLDAFVASSPLAGLESLSFDDALQVAAGAWGSVTGPDAASLRRAIERGRISPADVDDALVAAGLAPTPDVVGGGRSMPRVMVARHLVLADGSEPVTPPRPTPLDLLADADVTGARAARRARTLGDHLAARAAGSTEWPSPPSMWAALRADEPGLDAALWVDGAAAAVAALPEEPDAAVAALLDQLGVPDDARIGFLGRVLARDPGWPAHLAWRARTGVPLSGESGAEPLAPARDLLELVAVRLALEVVVVGACARRCWGRLDGGARCPGRPGRATPIGATPLSRAALRRSASTPGR